MNITASEVLKIAQQEIGYTEGANNWTKYAKELDSIGYFNGPKQNVAWCATFVAWCFYKASDKSTALNAQYQPSKDNCGCSCKYNANYYRNKSKFYSTPNVGDVFFVGSKGSETHMGLVLSVNNGTITTIEGNHGDKVASIKRNISDLGGFGRPAYTSNISNKYTAEDALNDIQNILNKYNG